ncbi:MAG: DUF3568 domain-containing protein [Candidatus Omnitrophica bacterium]|nr:DUF3568 domain-containing protein [Candidatus Omnitrophota bacterium]
MRRILVTLLLAVGLCANLMGCAPLVVGAGIGLLGGYAASKDTICADTDKDFSALWDTALQIARIRGTIKDDNYDKGTIKLITFDSSIVWIKISRITKAASKICVSARKFKLPNFNLAQDIFVKIMEQAGLPAGRQEWH